MVMSCRLPVTRRRLNYRKTKTTGKWTPHCLSPKPFCLSNHTLLETNPDQPVVLSCALIRPHPTFHPLQHLLPYLKVSSWTFPLKGQLYKELLNHSFRKS